MPVEQIQVQKIIHMHYLLVMFQNMSNFMCKIMSNNRNFSIGMCSKYLDTQLLKIKILCYTLKKGLVVMTSLNLKRMFLCKPHQNIIKEQKIFHPLEQQGQLLIMQ
ncbi:unnamed protein product [Paramecium pentaurelia]|uniref:Uncharacterized protein n=1 Tax=Paramecium pentaurelia TaxID=43138 RepID=A0A8S1XJH0_9CILI|nr:unnamed protein product [Paramecium pentaurelia]